MFAGDYIGCAKKITVPDWGRVKSFVHAKYLPALGLKSISFYFSNESYGIIWI